MSKQENLVKVRAVRMPTELAMMIGGMFGAPPPSLWADMMFTKNQAQALRNTRRTHYVRHDGLLVPYQEGLVDATPRRASYG